MKRLSTFVACISLFTSGCTFCVNGRGIGCGGGASYVEPTPIDSERMQDNRETELREQLNRSFLIQLLRASRKQGSPTQDNAGLRLQMETEEQREAVGQLLADISKEITDSAVRLNRDELFRAHFSFGERLTRLKVNVIERGISPRAVCSQSVIQIPVRFIQELLNGAVRQRIAGDLETPLVPLGPFYPGTVVRNISNSPMEQFSESSALINTAAYRALAFILAHESAHAWSSNCMPSRDPDVQKTREALADLFASIVASEIYSAKCLKSPLRVRAETFSAMIGERQTSKDDLGHLVADRMSEMDLARFLVVGGSDAQFFFKSLGESVSVTSEEHHLPGLRVTLDLQARRELVAQFYNDRSAEMKIHKVGGLPLLAELVAPEADRKSTYELMKIGFIGVVYQEYTSKDLIKCSEGIFRQTISVR